MGNQGLATRVAVGTHGLAARVAADNLLLFANWWSQATVGLSRATKASLLGLPQATKVYHEQGFLEGLPRATKVFLCGLLQATMQAKGAADNLLLLGDNRQLVLLPLF